MKLEDYKKMFGFEPSQHLIAGGIILCPKCLEGEAIVTAGHGICNCAKCMQESNKWAKDNPQYFGGYPYFEDSLTDQRKEYFNSAVQPFRGGELAKEFVDAHPKQVKKMVEEGSVTQKEVNNAKELWKDLPGHSTRHSSK